MLLINCGRNARTYNNKFNDWTMWFQHWKVLVDEIDSAQDTAAQDTCRPPHGVVLLPHRKHDGQGGIGSMEQQEKPMAKVVPSVLSPLHPGAKWLLLRERGGRRRGSRRSSVPALGMLSVPGRENHVNANVPSLYTRHLSTARLRHDWLRLWHLFCREATWGNLDRGSSRRSCRRRFCSAGSEHPIEVDERGCCASSSCSLLLSPVQRRLHDEAVWFHAEEVVVETTARASAGVVVEDKAPSTEKVVTK